MQSGDQGEIAYTKVKFKSKGPSLAKLAPCALGFRAAQASQHGPKGSPGAIIREDTGRGVLCYQAPQACPKDPVEKGVAA